MRKAFITLSLIGIGFVVGQIYSPSPAEAGVVDRVVEELSNISAAVDRIGERLDCERDK